MLWRLRMMSVAGDITNLRGNLKIFNNPTNGLGDIVINGSIQAKTLNIVAGGSIFIELSGEGSIFNVLGSTSTNATPSRRSRAALALAINVRFGTITSPPYSSSS